MTKPEPKVREIAKAVPKEPWAAFAWFVSRCAEGFGRELLEQGKSATQAKNAIIGCFLDFAAGEACRVARSEGREPDPEKWRKAVDDAFARASARTVPGAVKKKPARQSLPSPT